MESKQRIAFNFYKSYMDVANELSDKDRLAFYDAIVNRQFYGIEPDLKGMAKFAYISQKHNIDAQVNGWESKMNVKLDPSQGGSQGGLQGGLQQEEGQEEGQEEEKGKGEEEKPKAKKFSPPTQSEVISYFLEKGYTQEAACKAFDYYDVADWTDSTGKKIKNWKQKMIAVWFKEENKAGYRNPNQPPKRITPDPPPFVSCIKSPEDLIY